MVADMLIFFFKQKTAYEIRNVTGVQTCALPILCRCKQLESAQASQREYEEPGEKLSPLTQERIQDVASVELSDREQVQRGRQRSHPRRAGHRSEERRVGKACRARGWAERGERRV